MENHRCPRCREGEMCVNLKFPDRLYCNLCYYEERIE